MKTLNKISLELFNAVLKKDTKKDPIFLQEGVFIPSEAVWAVKEIKQHLKDLKLSGEELNKTFYKSWEVIQKSDRFDLLLDQIVHYMTTYGSNYTSEVYIPEGKLDIPDLKVKVSVILALTKEELIEKSLNILCSGIALKEETLKDIFTLLESLEYTFTGEEGIKNKEANIILADKYNVYPKNVEEFLRYVVFKMTEKTLLIKNEKTKIDIVNSQLDVSNILMAYDIEKLSSIFNRYKVLFLSIKQANKNNIKVINKIAKLSKKFHKPMIENPLNLVTNKKLHSSDLPWLENANIYSLFKALAACYNRKEGQKNFVYRIRNGKSFAKSNSTNVRICEHNYDFILGYLKSRYNGKDKTVYIPKNIEYALPTSEKMFVGNIPTGTKFFGKNMAAGVYWLNSWGARDIDISGLSINGKVGWNSCYYNRDSKLTYSGDLTDATNGAVEYLLLEKGGSIPPTLVMSNVFNGSENAGYKIIIGKGNNVTREYMMNPNNVMAEVKVEAVQKNMVLGMLMDEGKKVSFTLLNFGAGQVTVSSNTEITKISNQALFEQWKNPLSLNKVLSEIGFNVINKLPKENEEEIEVDIDLSLDKLNKSTFIEILKES